MSHSFGTPNTQPGFTPGTAAQPAGTATSGNIFGAARVGAGDANKPANLGLPQMTLQSQAKPAAQAFSTTFATPTFGAASTGVPTFGASSTGAPTFGTSSTGVPTFGASSTGVPTFGAAATGAPTFGATLPTTIGFGTPASGTTGFTMPQSNAAAPPANTSTLPGGLTYGTPIGTSTAATSQPVQSGFPAASGQTSSLGLGTLGAPSTTPGFNFGANAATTTSSAPVFNLGGTPAASGTQATGETQFGAPKSTASATTGGIAGSTFGTPGIGGAQIPPSSGMGFNMSGTPSQTAPGTGANLAGGTPASSAAGGFTLSGAQTQTAQTPLTSFNLGATPTATSASASTGFNLGTQAAATTFSLGSTAPTTAAPAFILGGTTTAASTQGFTLGKSTATSASTVALTSAAQPSLGTATNVTSSTTATSQPGGINFCQLEESINKWTLELEEQEKAFVNQATQVNAWDRLLIANGEKIVTLNQEVERVKLEQQQLEQELDYVVGQQRELQDCLVPLEKELGSVSASDPEREYTYRLAENLDTQLKQMSEDLKEIIEHLNEANRSQDSSDPIVQIGKILNAHMNSLQWLDQRTGVLQTKIQQIDQLHQNFRQEHERSFNLAYN